jgi:hypothetical protein
MYRPGAFGYPAIAPQHRFVMTDKQTHIYRVIFHNQGQVYEVYAHSIYQSDLYGFIEVEDYIFGKRSQMLIDPGEDKLKTEFEGVERSFIPMHAVIRIDEVEKEGVAKITDSKGENVTPFPVVVPRKDTKK